MSLSYDPRALILAAFEAAAKSGRADGMTAAVLKNRMIQLSDGAFDERGLGHESFSAFLAANSEVVDVDRSVRPPLVRLRGDSPHPSKAPPPESQRIRPDLWRALMDYSSGVSYFWDVDADLAVPGTGGDKALLLPTFTPAELHDLRSRFEAHHRAPSTEAERLRLASWLDNDLGTSGLPPRLRGPWNHALKEESLSRLSAWFSSRGLPAPSNVVQVAEVKERRKADELRDWVHAVVDAMSEDELRGLDLPAPATLRASRK